jgi:hypothetical protein
MSEPDPVTSLGDADLNLTIAEAARTEAASAGRRLAAIAELAHRRLGSKLAAERERWGCDATDSCAAEVAADLTITHRQAIAAMHQGLDLRDRIALVGKLLQLGEIPLRVATAASWRTRLITDPEVIAKVDAEIAAVAINWGTYPQEKLVDAIDDRIARHDPDAVRCFHTARRGFDVRFGKKDDDTGSKSVYGRMSAINAELSERRIVAMIDSVCRDDPRTVGQRRADAWGVIAAGGDHLPCLCGTQTCPAPTGPDARGKHFDILVLTDDPAAGAGPAADAPAPDDRPVDPRIDNPDYDMSQHWYDDPADDEDEPPPPDDEQDQPPRGEDAPAAAAECAAPTAESQAASTESTPPTPCQYTSIIAGGGVVPPALLADLRRMGASVRTVIQPGDLTEESGYRPSTALRRMVCARDMTCRFPGCDRPAEYCDFDHAIPYADSRLTHPANGRVLCRKHHLLRTFWIGEGGWADEQLADGTLIWTSPSNLKHRAPPGSRIFFPDWDTTTPLPDGPPVVLTEASPDKGLRMPTRRRTRAQQRAANIRAERRRNRETRDTTPAPF